MDEPLSNLDALLRLEMRAELKRLLAEIGSTTVYVTHDQVEALSMGDEVAIMRAGRLIQVGGPLEVYDAPADRFVGGFIGNPPMNLLRATTERRDGRLVATFEAGGEIALDGAPAIPADRVGRPILLGIRAEHIEVVRDGANEPLRATALVVEPLGSHNLVTLQIGAQTIKATTHPDATIESGDTLGLRLDPGRIRWLDVETGVAFSAEPSGAAPASE